VVGFVAYATGEVRSPGAGALPAGTPLHDGEEVQAGAGARAHLVLADGTEVRLDRGARVRVPGGRRLDLLGGRAWARVTPGEPFRWTAGPATVTVLGTELSVDRERDRTGVRLFSGAARVEAGGAALDLAPGQETEFAGGALAEPSRIESEAVATGWMLELWAHSGNRDRELADHLDRMIAEMGRRKLAAIEGRTLIRELGPTCRVPLARFLVSEGAGTETEYRRKAARVLREIGDATVAPELAAALRDPDPEVRVEAARALQGISGGRVCPRPEVFGRGIDGEAAAAAAAWAREAAPGSGGPGR